MKWVIGIIIGVGFLTGGVFLLPALLMSHEPSLFSFIFSLLFNAAFFYGIGYFSIHLTEKKQLYNLTVAIMVPWVAGFFAWIALLILGIQLFPYPALDILMAFIFSAVGGIVAHRVNIKKAVL
ncbi:hypothetical protein [Mucilaginibacter sp.]|uniref:hypothetical protein n=1 Tax=Mucilaginibacter sp. TaxID=1882438 RepID=UPI002ED53E60